MADAWTFETEDCQLLNAAGAVVAQAATPERAEQIAREHNAHERLAEACERAYAVLTGCGEFITAADAVESINAALAAAKGDPNG